MPPASRNRARKRVPNPHARSRTPSPHGMNTGTRAAVPMPPKQVKPSAMNTRAPSSRAATAAATPAGPPPATNTSVSTFTGSVRA